MSGSRIIVVEDEADIRRMLEFHQEFEGSEVEGIANGGDPMARFEGDPPDALLLDVMLPHHDSIEIFGAPREHSAWKDVVRAFDAGADDHVVKPFQLDSLVVRLSRLTVDSTGAGGRSPTGS